MNAETIKNFFNGQFFSDGKAREVQMSLRFTTADGKICEVPGVSIWEKTTIGEIFHTYHDFLKERVGEEPAFKTDPAVDRVSTVDYRNNEYLVQYYTDGTQQIRKSDGNFLNLDSPTAKAILKKAAGEKE
ncbi:hypothetical protein [Flavilitoribacter nigricans]|uniref:Uncharacterized protein n=1 Tax=Flavilitoribacter nigricans (strain ATCC 23147 / DSM 23189 / NBRC 102662 / NCIMB 1420 / SS-2) TaxID=1122177 RepID=A0A2D0NCE5_FLAN2|nr:hypothetical protein [Flavilitoribacter nigricans]PHN06157.1 hypothetical protein CRP01_11270 [Flavilitoribacter nigricans DSM 23189 = NBRC 102662]